MDLRTRHNSLGPLNEMSLKAVSKYSHYMEISLYPDLCLSKFLWHVLSKAMVYWGRGQGFTKNMYFFPTSSKFFFFKIDKVDGSNYSGLTHSICLGLMFFMP